MPVRINGATSGYVELAAPAVAGSVVMTLPATTGTLAVETGAWTAWTPTITAQTGSITTYVVDQAAYSKIGRTVNVRLRFRITSAGTGSVLVVTTLPVVPLAGAGFVGVGVEEVNTGKSLVIFRASDSQAYIAFYDGTYPGAVNARIQLAWTYESAA